MGYSRPTVQSYGASMAFAIKAKIDGLAPLLRRLENVKRGTRNKILRPAVTKAARIVNNAAKTAVKPGKTGRQKTRNGILKKSLGVKIASYETTVIGVIGPRKGFKTQVGVRTRGGTKSNVGDPIYEDPANIAHLVEYGHGGPHPAPPHPFMRPAWENSRSEIKATMASDIQAGLEKLARE